MKILSMHYKEFLKHRDLTLDLEGGMNILRGANEKGKCLIGSTLIHTGEGTVRIASLDQNFAEGFTPITGEVYSGMGVESISHFFKESTQEVAEVRTKHGYAATGTLTHPLLTYNPVSCEHAYKKICNLAVGDFLCIDRSVGSFPQTDAPIDFNNYSSYKGVAKPFSAESMSPDLASVCGYLLANGSGNKGSLNLSSNNALLCDDFSRSLGGLGVTATDFKSKTSVRGVRISHTNFKRFIEHVFSVEEFPTARDKTVPDSILRSSKETQRRFLRSLFDCDGHKSGGVFEWVSASKSVADTVKVMLLNFGVVTTTLAKRVKGYDHDYWRTVVTGRDQQALWSQILFDSLKYSEEPDYWNSKNDTVPGLLSYIRGILKEKVQPNGWLTLLNGDRILNRTFAGTTGQTQSNMQVGRISHIIANVKSMQQDEDLQLISSKLERIQDLGYFYSEVDQVTPKGLATVYDITVPSSHSFVANGIVSHNSSTVEGLGYVLCGSSALAKSVEDTVNWNAKSKTSMKVTMRFEHAGQLYTSSRGASGAEVVDGKGEVLVTGHKPVTAFLENLLSIPAGRASQIMLANQNEILGVLALGPTAASEMIEKLADFSEIDAIIKRMIAELPNGDTKLIESQIESARASLAEIVIPVVPDHTFNIEMLRVSAAERTAEADKMAKIRQDILAAMAQTAVYKTQTQQKLSQAQACLTPLEESAMGIAALKQKETTTRAALAEIDKEYLNHAVVGAHLKITDLQAAMPEGIWESDLASLELEIDKVHAEIGEVTLQLHSNRTGQAAALARRILSTTCPTCKQSIGDPKVAEENNRAVAVEVDLLAAEIDRVSALLESLLADIAELKSLRLLHQQNLTKIDQLPSGTFILDKTTIPHGITFEYEGSSVPPVNSMTIAECNTRSAQLQKDLELCEKTPSQEVADEQVRAMKQTIKGLEEDLGRIITLYPPPESEQVEIARLRDAAQKATEQAQILTNEMRDANVLLKAALVDQERWNRLLQTNESKLKEMQENNVFIKVVKAVRLQVSEKLWGTVMAGVSGYVSRFRGTPSVVTRSANGFLVDGRAGRPSGSTLDILGLALRIVIAKMFANSGLLVLDEVSSGCDAERTANIAGVLGTCGFEQIVWVSHDDLAESAVGANLIEL